jgi:hypothetical protein
MENVIKVPQKAKISLSYGLAIILLGIHTQEMKSVYQRDTNIPMFMSALFIIAM